MCVRLVMLNRLAVAEDKAGVQEQMQGGNGQTVKDGAQVASDNARMPTTIQGVKS